MTSAPLAGRRIIELGTMLAAPFAAHILSQLGAQIIKVEPPAGDPTRSLVRGGPSGTFIAYSHGKKERLHRPGKGGGTRRVLQNSCRPPMLWCTTSRPRLPAS